MKTKTIKLDFDFIREWRDGENDDLPAYSMLSFYKAAGILDAVKEMNGSKPVAFYDVLSCNWPTHKKIKNFLEETWQIFSLKVKKEGGIGWNTSKYEKGTQHWARNLTKRVKASIGRNFMDYCPFINDDLDDDVIIIEILEESDKQKEKIVEPEVQATA